MNLNHFLFFLPDDECRLAARLLPRKRLIDRSLISDVSALFEKVREQGDAAILEATKNFDRIEIPAVAIPRSYVERCVAELPANLKQAVLSAQSHIEQVNRLLLPEPEWKREIRPGVVVGEKSAPLESVGLYVPARKGPLVSTALMLVSAAKVAGVPRIAVAMPPRSDGMPDPATVAAASVSGATEFITGNGVALIAGLTVGTNVIREVGGVYGPGPAGIAAAMSVAFSFGKRTAIGLGPTDCAVVADESASADWIIRNLLCEAEHGSDSSSLLVTSSKKLATEVAAGLRQRIASSDSMRKPFLEAVFGESGLGAIVVTPCIEEGIEVVNDFAPEHLLVCCTETTERIVLEKIRNAGEILIGTSTPFSAANYAIGITAVLPTNGLSRAFSGITCRDMLKTTTIGQLSSSALNELMPIIRELGHHEGLPHHVAAAQAIANV